MKKCYKCGAAIEVEKVSRRDECERCGSDVHVCLNCTFHAEGRANQCMEPQAERVTEKHRSNYCDYFRFKEEGEKKSGKESAENAWKELFKKEGK
jgi:hypothetical protein